MADLLKHIADSGFPHMSRLVHVFVGGSELHGAKVQGTDDLDIYGAYIEPPDLVLGLESLPHYVWSTAGNDRRNGPADVDVTLYSLRKWAGLACKGNPTALHFLFAEGAMKSPTWSLITKRKEIFLSRLCAKHFMGFANDQLARMTGKKGRGKKGQRPELEEKYGYDVKAAMHTLRLLYECKEVLRSATITLPRPERDLLIRVRTGKFTLERVLDMANRLFAECEEETKKSALPDKVDRRAVSQVLTECYLRSWQAE
jgi:predicted nucleotidyltransferase